jgi:hypothetical protein
MERPGLTLRAGRLSARFDRGALRWLCLGDHEVLRGIYPAVRGPAWRTVVPRLDGLRIEQDEDGFHAKYRAVYEDGPLRFVAEVTMEARGAGPWSMSFDGRAESSFLKNRIGLCVLHPLEGCAGRPVEIEHGDSRLTRGLFPAAVSPHQPFLDIRAIRHAVGSRERLEVRCAGEWFEMEDHRNWSDASFKTYSTPLARPFPARLEAGETVHHEVAVRLLDSPADGPNGARREETGLLPLPSPDPMAAPSRANDGLRVGLDLGALPHAPTEEERSRLRALRLDHLRVELGRESAWDETLARAAALTRDGGTRLEVAALVGEEGGLEHLAQAASGLPIDLFLVFRPDTRRSDPALLQRAREVLGPAVPGARVGGGADHWFAELNRHREAASGAEVVAFELCPQVHARDTATILENLASLQDMAATAASFAGRSALWLSPVTLGPRDEPADRRLQGELGGEWVGRLLAAAAEAGFSGLTLRPALGPGGLASSDSPAYRVLLGR